MSGQVLEPQGAPWWEILVRVSVTATTEGEALEAIARSGLGAGASVGEAEVLEVEPVQGWES